MFSQFLIKIIGIFYKLYLTNKTGFGDNGNAILASGLQIYIIALTISSISLPNAISKLVSEKIAINDRNGAHRIFKISITFFGFISFIISFLVFTSSNYIANLYLHIPEAKLVIMALAPSIFVVSVISIIKGYFNGIEQMQYTAKAQSIEQLIKTIYTIILVEIIGRISKNNTGLMAAIAGGATSFASITTFIYLIKIYCKQKTVIWKQISKTNKESIFKILKNIIIVAAPIAISSLLAVMTKTIDTVTIVKLTKNIVGEKQAIFEYGILTGKIEMLIALPYSFNIAFATALIPTVSKLFEQRDYETVYKRIKFSLLVSILIGLVCSSIMYTFSNEILMLLFPNASAGSEMLKIHSISILIVVITQTMSGILQGIGKATKEMLVLGMGLVCKIMLNYIFLPRFGIVGAIYSTISTQIIVMIFSILYVKKYLHIKLEKKKFIINPIIAAIIMNISFNTSKNYNFFCSNKSNFLISIVLRHDFVFSINLKNENNRKR